MLWNEFAATPRVTRRPWQTISYRLHGSSTTIPGLALRVLPEIRLLLPFGCLCSMTGALSISLPRMPSGLKASTRHPQSRLRSFSLRTAPIRRDAFRIKLLAVLSAERQHRRHPRFRQPRGRGLGAAALDGAACMMRPMDSWACGGGVRLHEVIAPTSLDLVVAGDPALFGPRAGSSPIPEPSTWAMLALGFLGLGGLGLSKRKRAGEIGLR